MNHEISDAANQKCVKEMYKELDKEFLYKTEIVGRTPMEGPENLVFYDKAFDKIIFTESTEEEDEYVKRVCKARSLIREKHPISNEFIQDSIQCPFCEDGKIYYRISDHCNGHIHAMCSTKDCLMWME